MHSAHIHIEVSAIRFREIADDKPAEPSSSIRERVTRARSIQQERFGSDGIFAKAHMKPVTSGHIAGSTQAPSGSLRRPYNGSPCSPGLQPGAEGGTHLCRHRGQRRIVTEHISEAIQYRSLDRRIT